MKSNFEFLEKTFPVLSNLGSMAENYLYSDTNSCLIKLGLFGETTVNLMFKLDGINPPDYDNTHANRIKLLKKEGLISQSIDDIFYALRTARNKAVHSGYESFDDCVTLLEMAHKLGVWFMQTYGEWQYDPIQFVLPSDNSNQVDYQALLKEKEELIAKLAEQVDKQTSTGTISTTERLKRAASAAENMRLSEKETRYLIDEQLRKVGWEADTINLRYSKGTKPEKGRNIAIAEWPTDSTVGDHGYADYALFIGLKLVGIIEAKRMVVDIPSVLDYQCKDYAKNIKEEHAEYLIDTWGEFKAPLLFATNGRKYLKHGFTLDLAEEASLLSSEQAFYFTRNGASSISEIIIFS